MLIAPKKGYRICVDCGKISRVRQLKEKTIPTGKKIKCCPHCGVFENVSSATPVFNVEQAEKYFMLLEYMREDSKKYFCGVPDDVKKQYAVMYDTYGIPQGLRIYDF